MLVLIGSRPASLVQTARARLGSCAITVCSFFACLEVRYKRELVWQRSNTFNTLLLLTMAFKTDGVAPASFPLPPQQFPTFFPRLARSKSSRTSTYKLVFYHSPNHGQKAKAESSQEESDGAIWSAWSNVCTKSSCEHQYPRVTGSATSSDDYQQPAASSASATAICASKESIYIRFTY